MMEMIVPSSLSSLYSIMPLGLRFGLDLTGYNLPIVASFLITILAANFYFAGSKLLRGFCNLYGFCSIFTVLASDYLSIFAGLEVMLVFSSGIIFLSAKRPLEIITVSNDKPIEKGFLPDLSLQCYPITNQSAAGQYFILHLFSSTIILISLCFVINKNLALNLTNLKAENLKHLELFAWLLLSGLLINIGMLPFSRWVLNCYPVTSSSAFLFLITFTTKVNLILILKLFWGLTILKYAGILMMLYGGIFAYFSSKGKLILCYIALSQIGFILAAIGAGGEVKAIYYYIAIYILYSALLVISTSKKGSKNIIHYVGLVSSFFLCANFPFSITFILKDELLISFDSYCRDSSLIANIFIVAALGKIIPPLQQNQLSNAKSIIVLLVPIALCNFLFLTELDINPMHILKQLMIIGAGTAIFFCTSKYIKELLFWPQDILSPLNKFFISSYKQATSPLIESYGLRELMNQFKRSLAQINDQKTSIFIIFSLITFLLFFIK